MPTQYDMTRLHDLTGLEQYFEDVYAILGRDFMISSVRTLTEVVCTRYLYEAS